MADEDVCGRHEERERRGRGPLRAIGKGRQEAPFSPSLSVCRTRGREDAPRALMGSTVAASPANAAVRAAAFAHLRRMKLTERESLSAGSQAPPLRLRLAGFRFTLSLALASPPPPPPTSAHLSWCQRVLPCTPVSGHGRTAYAGITQLSDPHFFLLFA